MALLCLLSGLGMGGDSSSRVFPYLVRRRLAEGPPAWLSFYAAAVPLPGNDLIVNLGSTFLVQSGPWFPAWDFVLALEHTRTESCSYVRK